MTMGPSARLAFWALVAIFAIAGYLRLAFAGVELLYASVPVAADPVVPQIQAMELLIGVGLLNRRFCSHWHRLSSSSSANVARVGLASGVLSIPFAFGHIFAWPIASLIYGGIGMGVAFSKKAKSSEAPSSV